MGWLHGTGVQATTLRGYRFVVLKCLMTGIKFSPITGGGAGCSLELPGAIRSSYSLVCILLSTTS